MLNTSIQSKINAINRRVGITSLLLLLMPLSCFVILSYNDLSNVWLPPFLTKVLLVLCTLLAMCLALLRLANVLMHKEHLTSRYSAARTQAIPHLTQAEPYKHSLSKVNVNLMTHTP